jgi:hypothetical protein
MLAGTGRVPETDSPNYLLLLRSAKHDYEIHYPGERRQQAKHHAAENE